MTPVKYLHDERDDHRCGRPSIARDCLPYIGANYRGTWHDHPWTRALVVTAGLSQPYGKLDEIDLAAAVESVRKRFGRSGLRDRIIIGAIDISLYLKTGKIIGWQLILDLLIEGNDRPGLQKARLRRRFRLSRRRQDPTCLQT